MQGRFDNRPFTPAPEEVAARKLLPQFETRFPASHVVPIFESLLQKSVIPHYGVTNVNQLLQGKYSEDPFVTSVINSGIFNPDYRPTSHAEWETTGKVMANTSVALMSGRMTDRVEQATRVSDGTIFDMNRLQKNIEEIEIDPTVNYLYVTDGYLHLAQLVLLSHYSNMLNGSLYTTIEEIRSTNRDDPNNPWSIMYRNLRKYVEYGNRHQLIHRGKRTDFDVYTFIKRGMQTAPDISYAMVEVSPQVARRDFAQIQERNSQSITRDEMLSIFSHSVSLLLDLAHKDFSIQDKELDLITEKRIRNIELGELASFVFKPEYLMLSLIHEPGSEFTGILQRKPQEKANTEENARQLLFEDQIRNPEKIHSEPRLTYGCPNASRRRRGKKRVIPFVHSIAAFSLFSLNWHLTTSELK